MHTYYYYSGIIQNETQVSTDWKVYRILKRNYIFSEK